jgi:hypothetical protein
MEHVIAAKPYLIGDLNVIIFVNFALANNALIMGHVMILLQIVLMKLVLEMNVTLLALKLIVIVNYVIEWENALNV